MTGSPPSPTGPATATTATATSGRSRFRPSSAPSSTATALVVERAAGREQGTWGLPGGHLAAEDDTSAAAAARELAEETGLEAHPADLVLLDALLEDNDDGSSYLTVGFAVDVADVAGEARSADNETTAVRYVDPGTFAEPTFRPSDLKRLAAAIEMFR